MAPEVLKKKYTEASDLWSLGIVIMMILTGVVPIGSGGHEAIRRAIALAAENPTKLTKSLKKKLEKSSLKLSKNCVDFVLKLLTVNVDHRMTAEQAAQHPWLTTGGEGGRGPNRPSSAYAAGGEVEKDVLTVRSLKQFKEHTKMKQSALLALSFVLTTDDLTRLSATFARMDVDKNGTISLQEFTDVMVTHGLKDRAEIKAAFDAIDQDSTGVIKYSEFVAAALEESTYNSVAKVEAAFHTLDIDNSGAITVQDFRMLLGDDLDAAVLDKVIGEADFEKDGMITIEEFKRSVQGGLAAQ